MQIIAKGDLLAQAIEHARPLFDRRMPPKARLRTLWAAALRTRKLGSADVIEDELFHLANDTGLIADLGRFGEEDVRHVLSWAARGMNPFEVGPLR